MCLLKKERDAEKADTLTSLRLSVYLPLPLPLTTRIFKGVYFKSGRSYQKVTNYKNVALVLIYKTILNLNM